MKGPRPTTRDADIRPALRARLGRRHAGHDDVVIVEELPVARGSSRLDLAVINGRIEGFEIKSARDTLDRLRRQVAYGSPAVERATLVAAPEHIPEALHLLPAWWSVVSAEMGPRGAIHFSRYRRGAMNPRACPRAFVDLLERKEIVALLAAHGRDRGMRTAALFELADHALNCLEAQAIFEGVKRQLKLRAIMQSRHTLSRFGRTAMGSGLARPISSLPPEAPAQ